MNLKHIKITNCLGIEEKEINVGKITLIEGESESGKTSIIDSIRKGLKNENVRPKFVRGNNEGIVFLQFDNDLEVTRTVKADNKGTLKVTKEGMSPKGPQGYLNGFLGENDFAPIDWLTKTDKEQTEDLLQLLPIKLTKEDVTKLVGKEIDIDYDLHGLVICEELEKKYMEVRRDMNSNVKSYKETLEMDKSELPNNYDPKKYRDIKLNDLFEKIKEKEDINNLINIASERISSSTEKIEQYKKTYDERLEDLEIEFKRRKEELQLKHDEGVKQISESTEKAKAYLNEHKKTNTDSMREEVKEIEEGQSYLRMYDRIIELENELKDSIRYADEYTKIIEDIRELPGKLLKTAESPIPGMGVEDGQITIEGLPIKNLSDGAKMRLAIQIAKETSSELKLILLNGFEQLNWSLQKEMFKEMQGDEFQYIITKVSDGPLSISTVKDSEIINTETGEIIDI